MKFNIWITFLNLIILSSCNNAGVFEPGETQEDTSLVVSTEKLTGFTASNNLGAYLDSDKTINAAFALVEEKTYMSDVVNNSINVNSGDTVPSAINSILEAIEILKAPIDNTVNYFIHNQDNSFEELTELALRNNVQERPNKINQLLYLLIKQQQKQISELKNELKNLSSKTNNLY